MVFSCISLPPQTKISLTMAENVVIVESPAKAKTIEKFLGPGYKVVSSFGHIRDLPKDDKAIDIEHGFEPKYVVSNDKKKVVAELRKLTQAASKVWLASDEDREGEAIAWHLYDELGLTEAKTERIVFHEITKNAILKAIENPRKIDKHLVDAQQARRILDRLVGFELSPVLWRKVRQGLSAGRVQSVAVRLISEREREINAHESNSTYRVVADFINEAGLSFRADLPNNFATEKEALQFLAECTGSDFTIAAVDKRPGKRSPAAPFTTSTLQQEASRKLGFSVKRTMVVAQKLYESGQITYMRTDSVNLSNDALAAAQDQIVTNYGKEYHQFRKYSTKSKGAQEAHEAIRPTNFGSIHGSGGRDETNLYQLIWKRAIASQMADAKIEHTVADITISKSKNKFVAKGEVITFDGFIKAYLEGTDDEANDEAKALPALKQGEKLSAEKITATERFSRPPARFTEASLVKKLEELGIGRPSTYAPTISTIQDREYVHKPIMSGKKRNYNEHALIDNKIKSKVLSEITGADKNKLAPTDLGMLVNDYLVDHFETVLNFNFTAEVEAEFDKIAEGQSAWNKVIASFYKDFHPKVIEAAEETGRVTGERELGIDAASGKTIIARMGRYGAMVQIGEGGDEKNPPKFASIPKGASIETITLEEAQDLFKLPKTLGQMDGEDVIVNTGRYGPYVGRGKMFVSLGRDEEPMDVSLERAVELIQAKINADAPIAQYKGKPVQKGKGRFGPFIKWNDTFINVNKKYDYDSLSQKDIEELIEDKIRKDAEKVIHNFKEDGIRVEKARWGRTNIVKGKTIVELSKDVDATQLTLAEVKQILEKNAPKAKAPKKARAKK